MQEQEKIVSAVEAENKTLQALNIELQQHLMKKLNSTSSKSTGEDRSFPPRLSVNAVETKITFGEVIFYIFTSMLNVYYSIYGNVSLFGGSCQQSMSSPIMLAVPNPSPPHEASPQKTLGKTLNPEAVMYTFVCEYVKTRIEKLSLTLYSCLMFIDEHLNQEIKTKYLNLTISC